MMDYAGEDDAGQETPLKFLTFPVTVQPVDAVALIGGDAVFHGAFSIPGGTAVTYKWQFKKIVSLRTSEGVPQIPTAGGVFIGNGFGATQSLDIWNDLTEMTGVYEGVDTATLTVKNVDSFLVADAPAQFRLKVVRDLVPTIPSFTVGAAVTAESFFNWAPGPNAIYIGQVTPDFFDVVLDFNDPDPGAWTLTWEFVSGSADISWVAAEGFTFTGLAESGLAVSVWRRKATRGMDEVLSDPQTIVYYAAPAAAQVPAPDGFLFPYYETQSGAPMNLMRSLDNVLEVFQSFFTICQVNTRWAAAPAVTIADLSSPSGIFTGLSAPAQPAGTFVSAVFGMNADDGTPFFYLGVPNNPPFSPVGASYGLGSYFYLGLVNPFA